MQNRIGISLRCVVVAALAMLVGPERGVWASFAPPNEWERCLTFDPDTGEPRIDATCFFDALVDRYRNLTEYEDVADVLQVTERRGEAPRRVETRIGSRIEDGLLHVETPASETRRRLGLDAKPRMSAAMLALRLRYNLWLAPHMALKFGVRPERELRPGGHGDAGFVTMEAEAVTIDDKPMVHLELTSAEGPEGDGARFDLFVNPQSMLVERIQGEQRLPGGARYETRLDITPTRAVAAGEAEEESTATPATPETGDPAPDSVPSFAWPEAREASTPPPA